MVNVLDLTIKDGFEAETTISNLQVHLHQWDRRTMRVISFPTGFTTGSIPSRFSPLWLAVHFPHSQVYRNPPTAMSPHSPLKCLIEKLPVKCP